MHGLDTAIDTALLALQHEIAKRNMFGSVGVHREGQHVCINLTREGRSQWLGHSDGQGYYLVADPADDPSVFFELTPDVFVTFLPQTADTTLADDFLETLTSPNPDVAKLEAIIDSSHVTDQGLDVLSTIAAIRARDRALHELRTLVDDDTTPEVAFQRLFASEPWMLGAQYSELVASERLLWFGARVDLLLANVLGYVDIIELKRPTTRMLAPASRVRTWRQSSELSDAYAQAQQYLRLVDENRHAIEAEIGIGPGRISRMYRSSVVIVVGRQPAQQDVLRELNNMNPRISLMTYDEVIAIAERTIQLFRRRLVSNPALSSG